MVWDGWGKDKDMTDFLFQPSGGVVLLRNLTLTYYSAVIDIWVSFVTVVFVKYL